MALPHRRSSHVFPKRILRRGAGSSSRKGVAIILGMVDGFHPISSLLGVLSRFLLWQQVSLGLSRRLRGSFLNYFNGDAWAVVHLYQVHCLDAFASQLHTYTVYFRMYAARCVPFTKRLRSVPQICLIASLLFPAL